jgi:predicted ATP-grasp superfamily ATP-dependent carboligase
VPVSASSSDRGLSTTLGLEPSRYEGPTGILGVIQDACSSADMSTVSFWAAVPHYVAQPPSPKASLALLRKVEDLLDVTVPLADLPEQARAWEHGVNELAEQDTEVAEYVRSLEEQKDAAELPEATGEAIAREFERYLRRRDDRPPTP